MSNQGITGVLSAVHPIQEQEEKYFWAKHFRKIKFDVIERKKKYRYRRKWQKKNEKDSIYFPGAGGTVRGYGEGVL